MRRRMKTHPRSRACFGARNTRARREIRSRDRHVPRRRPRDARRAHGAFRTRNTSISAKFAKFAPCEKKKKRRSATPEKIFSRARSDLERGGFARSTTRGSRAIDDRRRQGRAIARSIDRARVPRPADRARAAFRNPRARARETTTREARGRARARARARGRGFGAKKFARGDVEAREGRRGRRRRGGGGDSSIHRAIEPSKHPSRRGGRDGGHGRGVATSIDARAGGERDAR